MIEMQRRLKHFQGPNTLVNNQTMVPDGIQQRSDAYAHEKMKNSFSSID